VKIDELVYLRKNTEYHFQRTGKGHRAVRSAVPPSASGILHAGWSILNVVVPVDQPVLFQQFEPVGQNGVTDELQIFFQPGSLA
jgi:hypothetical protein